MRKAIVIDDDQLSRKDVEFDWSDRVKQWKKVQMSSGAITSFENLKQDTFKSCSVSVLGCLQADFTAMQL